MKKIVLKIFMILVISLSIIGLGNSVMADEETCTHEYVVKYDETTHWKECSICGKVDSTTIVEHAYAEDVCECGAKKPCEEHKEYEMKYDETNHWEECKVCGTVKENSKVAHVFENGVCVCGAEEPTKECEHKEYEVKYDETNHWEECKECKEIKTDSKEAHTFVDGVCECGAKEPTKECEHKEYEVKNDETNHWEECKECKEIKADSKEAHVFEEYKDNKDGTHTAKCKVCAYELTQKHDAEQDCEDCGYKAEKKDNKVDNTVTDEKMPQTGKNGIAFLAITILTSIVVVSVIKIKQYKEI